MRTGVGMLTLVDARGKMSTPVELLVPQVTGTISVRLQRGTGLHHERRQRVGTSGERRL